jgi:hypothetical protein
MHEKFWTQKQNYNVKELMVEAGILYVHTGIIYVENYVVWKYRKYIFHYKDGLVLPISRARVDFENLYFSEEGLAVISKVLSNYQQGTKLPVF